MPARATTSFAWANSAVSACPGIGADREMSDPLTWIRAVHFAATLALAGAAIFGAAIAGPALRVPPGDGAGFRVQLVRIAWSGLAIAVVSGAAWLVLLATQMSERAPTQAFSDGTVWTVLL